MITVRLHETQALAILSALEGHRLGGKAKASMRRGIDRIEASLGFAQMHPLDEALDHLGDVMMDVRSRVAFERLRDLLELVRVSAVLWSAAEQLPPPAREGLLDPAGLGDVAWMARARAVLRATGWVEDGGGALE